MGVFSTCKYSCDLCKKEIASYSKDGYPEEWSHIIITIGDDKLGQVEIDICDECLNALAKEPAFQEENLDISDADFVHQRRLEIAMLVAQMQARIENKKAPAKKAAPKKRK